MKMNIRIISTVLLLAFFIVSKSQDTLYRIDGKVTAVKITKVNSKIVDFLPWDEQDGPEHEISRSKVAYIVYQNGRVESISDASIKSTPATSNSTPAPAPVVTTPAIPDKTTPKAPAVNNSPPITPKPDKVDNVFKPVAAPCLGCDATVKFAMDSTIKLCGFKSSTDAKYKGQKHNNFYVNDPDKKFINSKQLICLGIDFSLMKDVNTDDIDNSADLKQKELSKIAAFMNDDPGNYYLSDKFGPNHKVKPQMDKMKGSWRALDDKNWVTGDDYNINPGRIPAIIAAENVDPKNTGLGAIFILEKFSKPLKTLSGYWVIFDFSDKKVLLIDRLVYTDVTPPTTGNSWNTFWKTAFSDAQVWHPFDIEKYCELVKKNQFEQVCGN